MSEITKSNHQRRTFLGILLGGGTVVLGAFFAWPLFRFLAPRKDSAGGTQVKVPKKEVKLGGAKFFSFQGHPAVLLQPKVGEYVALTAVCTHLGCVVKWVDAKGEFLCPCHGGRFSSEGDVIGGPPPTPLEHYTVKIVDTDLVIG